VGYIEDVQTHTLNYRREIDSSRPNRRTEEMGARVLKNIETSKDLKPIVIYLGVNGKIMDRPRGVVAKGGATAGTNNPR
jgi:hypothetical protein